MYYKKKVFTLPKTKQDQVGQVGFLPLLKFPPKQELTDTECQWEW